MRNNNEGSHEGKETGRGRGRIAKERRKGRKGPLSENDFVELTDLRRGAAREERGIWETGRDTSYLDL